MESLSLRGKWRLSAHGQSLVLTKRAGEKPSHVWLKGLLWALYLPAYPQLTVEVAIGHRYKPDLVAFSPAESMSSQTQPIFWGEAGQVTLEKLERLFRQFPRTHFAVAKWGSLGQWPRHLDQALASRRHQGQVDLLRFEGESPEAYLQDGKLVALDEVRVASWSGGVRQ